LDFFLSAIGPGPELLDVDVHVTLTEDHVTGLHHQQSRVPIVIAAKDLRVDEH